MSDTRAKRPTPERIDPNRGMLGVFGQTAWRGPSEFGHPLGPGFDDAMSTENHADLNDPYVVEASDLVDRHIQEAARERAAENNGLLGTLADVYSGVNGADLTKVVATLTRTYADVATKWVDLASTVVEGLAQMRNASGSANSGQPPIAGPILSLRSSVPVEAQIEMLRGANVLKAQPLGAEDPAVTNRITDVKIEEGKLKLAVAADQPPGLYHGLLFEDGGGPVGVVTVEVFEGDAT